MTDPRWLQIARRFDGLREIVGPRHNPTIIRWLEKLRAWWRDDETPWCGVAVASWLSQAGHPIPKHYYRALAWADYGMPQPGPLQGAIAVLSRKGGGHVGLVTGVTRDGKHVRLLGGNQNDAVNEAWFPASRIVAYRLPVAAPRAAPVVASLGTMSTSEA